MLRKDWARYCLRVVGSPSPWCTWPGSSGGPGGERRRTWRSPLYAIIVLVYISIFDPGLLSATHYPFSSCPFHYMGIILYITWRSFGNTLRMLVVFPTPSPTGEWVGEPQLRRLEKKLSTLLTLWVGRWDTYFFQIWGLDPSIILLAHVSCWCCGSLHGFRGA